MPLPTSRSSRTPALAQRRQLARRRREEARLPGRAQRRDLAGDEEDRVVAVERQRAGRPELRPIVVIVRSRARSTCDERTAGRAEPLDVQREPELRQPLDGAAPELVLAERGEEVAGAREPGELHRGDRAAAGRARTRLGAVGDLPGAGTWSTTTNSIHSTWPTTATLMTRQASELVERPVDGRDCPGRGDPSRPDLGRDLGEGDEPHLELLLLVDDRRASRRGRRARGRR